MKMLIPLFITTFSTIMLLGCGAGDGTGLDNKGQPIGDQTDPTPEPEPDQEGIQATLESIQETVLTPICAQCHIGNNAPLGLRMDTLENSIANLLNVDAVTNPLFKRIEPGNPESSFLYLKIIGDPQAGNQMPLGQTPLSAQTQQVIRQWIEEGAVIGPDQLTLGAKVINTQPNSLTLMLNFSQPIANATLQANDFQLIANDKSSSWPDYGAQQQLTWHSAKKLELLITDLDPDAQSVSIKFNQSHLSSVLSENGIWLDGNHDGIAGGEVQYDYSNHQ
jgi:hypothetical protein